MLHPDSHNMFENGSFLRRRRRFKQENSTNSHRSNGTARQRGPKSAANPPAAADPRPNGTKASRSRTQMEKEGSGDELESFESPRKKHAGGYSTAKVEPPEASESGDQFASYPHPSIRLGNFNLFEPTPNVKSTPQPMVNGAHHAQPMYSNNSNYNSSGGYWPYPNQAFLSGSPTNNVQVPSRPDLNYSSHPHGSYAPTYPPAYEFYPNSKYC